MAATGNRIVITAAANRYSFPVCITGISVCPSAAAWEVKLVDTKGATIWHQVGSTKDGASISLDVVYVDAINVETLTNVTSVVIYTRQGAE